MSGDFITSSNKVGAFRIWNVSQKGPKDILKVGVSGIRQFEAFTDDPNLYISVFKDGSLGLFNLKKKKVVWEIEAGHSETIFDIRFKPSDPTVLATGSFDGLIKIWDMKTMKLVSTLSQQAKKKETGKEENALIVYCIAWAPKDDNRIASSHANGEVVIWDYIKRQVICKISPGGETPIFRLDWNLNNKEYIACGSNEKMW